MESKGLNSLCKHIKKRPITLLYGRFRGSWQVIAEKRNTGKHDVIKQA